MYMICKFELASSAITLRSDIALVSYMIYLLIDLLSVCFKQSCFLPWFTCKLAYFLYWLTGKMDYFFYICAWFL